MQMSVKATPSHESKSACQPHGWRTFYDLTSDKATPSHESNRVSRSQSGDRFQLLSDKGNAFARSQKCVSAPRLAHVL